MKTISYFRLFGVFTSLVLLTSCSMLSPVTDDDVYVLSTPTLESNEELNDETSYQNYKYQKERQHQHVRYGFNTYHGIMIVMGNPYGYPTMFPYYGGYYAITDHAYYSPFYNNYFGYMGYAYPSYYNYPGSLYYMNYPFGVGYGNYYSPYYYGNNNNSKPSPNYNTHYSARNSVSGTNISRRKANNNHFGGGMTGMAKPTSTRSRSDYAHNGTVKVASRSNGTNVTRTSRPVERGVGLSRPGTRVTSVSYNRNTGSPAYQRSSNEVKSTIGRSGNNPSRDSRPTVSPSKTTTTPTQGRRRN